MNSKRCFIFTIPILLVAAAVVFGADRGIIRNTADLSHASGKSGAFSTQMIGIDDSKANIQAGFQTEFKTDNSFSAQDDEILHKAASRHRYWLKSKLAMDTKPATPASGKRKKITNSLGMEFVYIPQGEFMMGQSASEKRLLIENYRDEKYKEYFKRELPRHKVILTQGFYMQTTEVTVGQWRRFVNATGYKTEAEKGGGAYIWAGSKWEKKKDAFWDNPYFKQTEKNPATCVSWNDAQRFIKWLILLC